MGSKVLPSKSRPANPPSQPSPPREAQPRQQQDRDQVQEPRAQSQGQIPRAQDNTPAASVAAVETQEQENENANEAVAIEQAVTRDAEQTGTGDKGMERSWSSDSDGSRIVETGNESVMVSRVIEDPLPENADIENEVPGTDQQQPTESVAVVPDISEAANPQIEDPDKDSQD